MLGINSGEIAIRHSHGKSNIIAIKVEFDVSEFDKERLVNYFTKRLTGGESRRLEKEFESTSGWEKEALYEHLDDIQEKVAEELNKDQYREVVVL